MDLIIIRLFFSYKLFSTYYNSVDLEFIRNNSKQLEKLLIAVEEFHKKYPEKDISSSAELEVFFYSLYPGTGGKEREYMEPLFKKLSETTVNDEIAADFFREHRKRTQAAKLSLLGLQVAEGHADFSELTKAITDLESVEDPEAEYAFVVDDESNERPPVGIRWRQKILNKMLGSLRKGNFGFIFARPETGKTTIIADFCSHAVSQVEQPILWFNNEQPGLEVLHRCIQSYFGITLEEFYKHKREYSDRYYAETNHKIKIVDEASLSKKQVEGLCKRYTPSLIIFDQIDKIKGFTDDRPDLELKAIYQWARELAKKYGPVVGICQAGGTGEGKKWLSMDDVDGSKTAKQGEADWILGIGKSHQEGMESVRHLHLCKNKLLGDEDTDPGLRHGKAEILINANIARYEDIK